MTKKKIQPKPSIRKPVQDNSVKSIGRSYTKLWEMLLIFLLVFICYGNSIRNDYNIDDGYVVSIDSGNKLTEKGIKGIPEIFASTYSSGPGVTYGYRPLGKATMAIEYSLWGNNPFYSHFINVLLYALNIFLLLLFIQNIAGLLNYNNPFVIYLSILLFIVHPIHTEVVSSIKNREELLCYLFVLSAVLVYFKFLKSRNWIYLLWFILLTALAFFSKQTAVNIFGIIFLIIVFNARVEEEIFSTVKRYLKQINVKKVFGIFAFLFGVEMLFFLLRSLFSTLVALNILVIVFLLILIILWRNRETFLPLKKIITPVNIRNLFVLMAVYFIFQLVYYYIPSKLPEGDIGKQFESNPYYFFPVSHSFPIGMQTLWFYFKKLLIPYPLLYFYGYNMLPDQGWNSVYPYIGMLVFSALGIWIAVYLYRKKALFLIFWVLFYLVTIFPFSNVSKDYYVTGIVGERLIYQTSTAYCMILAMGIYYLSTYVKENLLTLKKVTARQLAKYFSAMLIIPFMIMTIDRNRYWINKQTLYEHDIIHLSNSARANLIMAGALMNKVDKLSPYQQEREELLAKAKAYYIKALQIYPQFDNAWLSLGKVYKFYYLNKDSALICFSKVDTTTLYTYVSARELMGSTYYADSNFSKSLEYYNQAFKLYPGDQPAYKDMIHILLRTGQYDEIIPLAKTAIKNNWIEGYVNMGDAYLNKKDTALAMKYYETALRNGANNEVLINNLKYYYKITGQTQKLQMISK